MIQAKEVRPAFFVYVNFPGNPQRAWSGIGQVDFQGETWTGIGSVIEMNSIAETTDTSAQGLRFTINGAPQAFLDIITGTEFQESEVEVWFCFLSTDEQTIYTFDEPLWSGVLDTDDIQLGSEGRKITLNAEHKLVDILRRREVRYTQADQEWLYPGTPDTGLNKMAMIQGKSVPWGRTQA